MRGMRQSESSSVGDVPNLQLAPSAMEPRQHAAQAKKVCRGAGQSGCALTCSESNATPKTFAMSGIMLQLGRGERTCVIHW
jgi:hypothetical protein